MNTNFFISLELMGKGMLSIFIVLILLTIIVTIFSKVFK